MEHDIIEKVISIVNTCLSEAELNNSNMNDNLEQYGFDSIAMIKVVISLEEAFCIEMPDECHLIEELNTVNKIVAVLNNLMGVDKNVGL